MLNFTFKNQTEILFGKGQLSEVATRLPENAKVLFLYGGGCAQIFVEIEVFN